jgi:hypothetical protein
VLIAELRFFLESAKHHLVEADIDLHLARWRREFSQRKLAREHLVKDHA